MPKEYALSKPFSEPASELDVQPSPHSFIVRMWREEPGNDLHQEIWRGYVTHIPGDERLYFTDVNKIIGFINSWLKEKK